MEYQLISDKGKNTTQIRIKLDSSNIRQSEFGNLILAQKYNHLTSKTWTLGHFKIDNHKDTFLLTRADGYSDILKKVPLELVYSFYKMRSGGVFGIFLYANSKELAKASPHGFPVFECLLGLDYLETKELIKSAFEMEKLHICFADKSSNSKTISIFPNSTNQSSSTPQCQFDLVQEISKELQNTLVENFEDLMIYHSNSLANFQKSMQELNRLYPVEKSPLLASQKVGFFRKLFKKNKHYSNRNNNTFAEKKKYLETHMSSQYSKFTNISESIKNLYISTFNKKIDLITTQIIKSEEDKLINHISIQDDKTKVYLYVSIFNIKTKKVTKYYEENSNEAGFGYMSFIAEHFLNKWPSPSLKYFMHLIICNVSGGFQVHNCLGDYGGNPQAPRNFIVYPVDILNRKEKRLINN